MKLRVYEDRLFAADLAGLAVYDLGGGSPARLRQVACPSEPNVYSHDASGERLTTVEAGVIARSFTAPGQEGHWSRKHSSVALYDLELNELARYDVGRRLDDPSLALSSDGTRLASIDRGAGVVVLDARTGAVVLEQDGDIGSGVSWSPDGRFVAAGDTGQGGGALYLLDIADGGARRSLPAPSTRTPLYDSPFVSVFTPDSATVVFTNAAWGSRGVTAYDVAAGSERWAIEHAMLDDDEESWFALELGLAVGGAVVLVGIEGGLHAFRVADGGRLSSLGCEGASDRYFAADDRRRVVWLARGGEIASEPYPEDWA